MYSVIWYAGLYLLSFCSIRAVTVILGKRREEWVLYILKFKNITCVAIYT